MSYFDHGLTEASFQGHAFPVDGCEVDAGHDAAEHTMLLRRGADIEPLGQRATRGKLAIPLFNAPALVARYGMPLVPDLYTVLMDTFRRHPLGELVHPLLGGFTALVKSWPHKLDSGRRDGWLVELEWVEHNGAASIRLGDMGAAPADPATTTSGNAAAADAAMTAADPAGDLGAVPTADVVDAQLVYLEGAARTPAEVAAAFRAMLAVVTFDLALFGDAAAYDVVDALEALQSSINALRAIYVPSEAPRRYVVPVTMALWQVAQACYGDASKDTLLASLNTVPDTLFVPAGTVLLVPPLAQV